MVASRYMVNYKCSVCNSSKKATQSFYQINGSNDYYKVCKECLSVKIIDGKGVNKKLFKTEVCEKLNMPFIEYEYAKLEKNYMKNPVGMIEKYIEIINKDHKGQTFSETSVYDLDPTGATKAETKKPEVTEEMVEFWGRGFSPDYYIDVQKRYDNFMEFEDESKLDYKKQSDYKTLCQLERKKVEMLQDKDTRASDLKAIVDSISKLSEDLNIKALQRKNDENDNGLYLVGLITKFIEDVKMTPIPKLEDIDWLGDMPRSDFDIEMAYFKSPLFEELGKPNPYKEIVEEDKKKYTPSDNDLDIERFEYEANFVDEDEE